MLQLRKATPIHHNDHFSTIAANSNFRAFENTDSHKIADPHHNSDALYLVFKRALDIAVSIAALIVLAPFFCVIALMIRADGQGPAIFRQERNGLNGRLFTIYKFRTMSVMESGHTARQACASDPRISRLGCTLRKLSIDELPQLFNVLRGDMSLVGPRPHAPVLDNFFAPKIPGLMDRYSVKPGLTGLAQVEGARGETATTAAMRRRLHFDRSYVKTASFGLDCWIIVKTAFVMIFAPNGE